MGGRRRKARVEERREEAREGEEEGVGVGAEDAKGRRSQWGGRGRSVGRRRRWGMRRRDDREDGGPERDKNMRI